MSVREKTRKHTLFASYLPRPVMHNTKWRFLPSDLMP
jgi:hypothetical protein